MKLAILNSEKLQSGLLHVARVGTKRGTNDATDFTGSGTPQAIVLATLKPGDVVFAHQARIDVITPVVNSSGATLTASLGITGTVDRFLPAANVKDATAKVIVPTVAGNFVPYVNNTGSDVSLILNLIAGSGNISDITAGELQVLFAISRVADRVTNMEA